MVLANPSITFWQELIIGTYLSKRLRCTRHKPLLCIISQSGAVIFWASSYISMAALCFPSNTKDLPT